MYLLYCAPFADVTILPNAGDLGRNDIYAYIFFKWLFGYRTAGTGIQIPVFESDVLRFKVLGMNFMCSGTR